MPSELYKDWHFYRRQSHFSLSQLAFDSAISQMRARAAAIVVHCSSKCTCCQTYLRWDKINFTPVHALSLLSDTAGDCVWGLHFQSFPCRSVNLALLVISERKRTSYSPARTINSFVILLLGLYNVRLKKLIQAKQLTYYRLSIHKKVWHKSHVSFTSLSYSVSAPLTPTFSFLQHTILSSLLTPPLTHIYPNNSLLSVLQGVGGRKLSVYREPPCVS